MKIVFVGKLEPNCTEAHLRCLFEPYGQVGRISIKVDQHGNPRGFALVEMTNEEDADKAISGLSRITPWILRS